MQFCEGACFNKKEFYEGALNIPQILPSSTSVYVFNMLQKRGFAPPNKKIPLVVLYNTSSSIKYGISPDSKMVCIREQQSRASLENAPKHQRFHICSN